MFAALKEREYISLTADNDEVWDKSLETTVRRQLKNTIGGQVSLINADLFRAECIRFAERNLLIHSMEHIAQSWAFTEKFWDDRAKLLAEIEK